MTGAHKAGAAPGQHWHEDTTQLYLREGDRIEAMNGPFGNAMLDAASLLPGDRVIDIGCGQGTTTVEAARRTAPSGAVVGVDISGPLLQEARRRARQAGVDNVDFIQTDAQAYPFDEAAFDAVISRFGVMFFDDHDAAFANFAKAVRPGGRLAIVCPAEPLQSEWIRLAFTAVAPHVGLPDLGPAGAPGTFAFADRERLAATIVNAGFSEVSVEAVVRPIRLGDDVDDVAAFITSLPEGRQLLAGKSDEKVAAAADSLKTAFAPHAGPQGVIVDETAWLAAARR
jgi:ubiquinone/menaquinone biosynthesis C-methylase UbiE